MQRPPVVGDVFADVDRLNVQARLRLSGLLAVSGRAPAILPGQLGGRSVPIDAAARAAVVATIESGLDPPALRAFTSRRLDVLVPALHGRSNEAVVRALPIPVGRVLLERAGDGALSALTVGEISSWSGFGRRRVVMVVSGAVTAGLALVAVDHDHDVDPAPAGSTFTVDDLVTVLAGDSEPSARMRGLLGELAESAPPDVRMAAGRILTIPVSDAERCVAALDRVLAVAGDERDRAVFEHGVLALGAVVTRTELAAVVGVGAERVRQLQVRTKARVEAALDNAPSVVRDVAGQLRERLGAAASLGAVDDMLTAIGLPPLPDSRSHLLVRMAGPYRRVAGLPGWVALDPAELFAETRRMVAEDGGVRLVGHVAKELEAFGVLAEHVGPWLATQQVRVADGLVVATDGSSADVAERVLHAFGRPLSTDEMAEWLPGGREAAEEVWSSRDRRFVVTGTDTLALLEWGSLAEWGDDIAITLYPDGHEADVSLAPRDTSTAGHDPTPRRQPT